MSQPTTNEDVQKDAKIDDAKIITQDGFAKHFVIKKWKRWAYESWKMLDNVIIPCFDLRGSSAVQQKT